MRLMSSMTLYVLIDNKLEEVHVSNRATENTPIVKNQDVTEVFIERREEKWILNVNEDVKIVESIDELQHKEINIGDLINIADKNNDIDMRIYVDAHNDSSHNMEKLDVSHIESVTIGSSQEDEIVYESNLMSNNFACIEWDSE